MTDNSKSDSIDEQAIVEFLQNTPDFFLKHSDLVNQIKLKHDSGSAVSLIEHQVNRLREQNHALQGKLGTLIANARENDRLFNLTRRAVNTFIEAQDLGDLVDALHYQFAKEFKIEQTSLLLFSEPKTTGKVQHACKKEAEKILGEHFSASRPICGQFTAAVREFIFTDTASQVGSMALTFLKPGGDPIALLAVGHKDETYYQAGTETLFLTHISDVLERQIQRLPAEHAG